MSILTFIKRVCVQKAVYWGSPIPNGYGGFTFATPVELKAEDQFGGVRWEERERIITDHTGQQTRSIADVMVGQELGMGGWLYLGSLNDFDSDVDTDNPVGLPGAYQIVARDITPLFRSTDKFVYTVYLGFGNL